MHKIALAAGAPSPHTSLSLGEFMSYDISPDPTLFEAFGDSHLQNVLPRERTDVAATDCFDLIWTCWTTAR